MDSFSDGGKFVTEDKWLKQSETMISEGADVIDIGGYSTRPGADDISEIEEQAASGVTDTGGYPIV